MSRRDFKLRSVLLVRKRALDAAQAQLGARLEEKDNEAALQRRSRARLRDSSNELHARLQQGATAATLRAVDGEIHLAHEQCVLSAERSLAIERAIDTARAMVTQAKKQLRSIEILEEHWRDQRRRERAKQDQKRLDEISNRCQGGLLG